MARVILAEKLYNREHMRRWINWQEYLVAEHSAGSQTFDRFIELLIELYAEYTPAFAAKESGLSKVRPAELEGTQVDEQSGKITSNGAIVGVIIDGKAYEGFPTTS